MYTAVRMAPAFRRKNHRSAVAGVALLPLLLGCEPNLVVGTWQSDAVVGGGGGGAGGGGAGTGGGGAGGSGGATDVGCEADGGDRGMVPDTGPVAPNWSTGFENALCDYTSVAGFCYKDKGASYEIVTAPVHSGNYAAAFNIQADNMLNGMPAQTQTRCVRQGVLPEAAYYSAFFYIPAAPTAANNWNLIHFRAGNGGSQHGLWDVSLAHQADGKFRVYVYDFLRTRTRNTTVVPAVPIGAWFQLEVYWKRATDATGEFTVWQDGEVALSLDSLTTDEDSTYEQWFVGNLAISLTPPDSVVYVDDVSISDAP